MTRPQWRPQHDRATLTDVAGGIAGPGEHPAEDASSQPFRAFNVVAVFEHGHQARRAFQSAAVEFPIESLSFVGLHREGESCDCRVEPIEGDSPGLAARVAARGAFLGAAAGAAITAVGVAVVPGIGPVIGAGLLGAALSGAGLGGATGGVVGAYAHLRESDAVRSTYVDVGQGRAVVGLHVDTEDDARRARKLLESQEPEATRVFDAKGHAIGR